jgi:hypothetical protein
MAKLAQALDELANANRIKAETTEIMSSLSSGVSAG